MQEIIIATKNKGKAAEFAAMFSAYGIHVKTLHDLDEEMPDIEETGTTFRENARLKAEGISKLIGKTVIADDSGLIVDALDGRPGVYSARFAGEPKDDTRNNEKLLEELENVPKTARTAAFTCVLALSVPEEETIYAEGKCNGRIASTPSGEQGFGYDPLFIPVGYEQTMAELDSEKKNQISHRYHALLDLEKRLQQKDLIGDSHV